MVKDGIRKKKKKKMNINDIRKFKRELLYYIAYLDGFGYLRWSKKKHKVRIAVNKRTWWIINSKLKSL